MAGARRPVYNWGVLRAPERMAWTIALGLGAIACAFLFWLGHAEERLPAPSVREPRVRPLPTVGPILAEDAPEDEPPPAAVQGPNELPATLTRRDLDAAMERVAKKVSRCPSSGPGRVVRVRLEIRPSGQTQSAVALGPDSASPLGKCVARAAAAAVFPRFSGQLTPRVELVYPFYLGTAPPRQVGNPPPYAH